MFNKRTFLLLFLLIIAIGTISSADASDVGDDVAIEYSGDKMEADNDNVIEGIDENTSNQASEINENDVIAASPDEVLEINTDGRKLTQLQSLIDQTSSGGTISLRFDYYGDSSSNRVGVTINKPLTINGNGHTIDANEFSRIFYIDSNNVVLNDITFKNGYYGNPNNDYSGHGGCIFINKGTTTLNNCNFYNNTAEYNGGAICSAGGLVINNCKFIDNIAIGFNVENNMGSVYGYGGAIYACSPLDGNKSMYITGSTFTNNNGRGGGAVYIDYRTLDINAREYPYTLKTVIKNTKFDYNYALYSGGAIYNCRDLDISDSTFYANKADGSGGAICLENGDDLKDFSYHVIPVNLEVHGNTVFSNNQAKYSGGAILYISRTTTFDWEKGYEGLINIYDNVRFEANHATTAGAISIRNINATVNGATFINNVASNVGAMYGGNATDCTFSGNSNPQTSEVKTINGVKLTAKQSGSTSDDKVTLTVTLTTAKGGAVIANEYVNINLNGETKKIRTDSRGQVSLNVNLPPKSYVATISHDANGNLLGASINTNVIVKKVNPKIIASKKTFKAKVKTKKYTMTLKNSKGQAMKNTKVKITVKGKTFTAKTNSKGKATFKITNLKKKGSFKATVKFAGNGYYNAASKKVTITVKK